MFAPRSPDFEAQEITEDLFLPSALPDGRQPEERVVLCGINWERYLELDKLYGDDRPGPRMFYLDGSLEIVTTSVDHEQLKRKVAGKLEDYLFHFEIRCAPRGGATLRNVEALAAAEPDESYCIGPEREIPQLVLEIALTKGGVSKLEIYRALGVEEVWIWQRNQLEIHCLRADGAGYDGPGESRLLPEFPRITAEQCARIDSWLEGCRAFEAALGN